MANMYKQFLALNPAEPLLIGTVVEALQVGCQVRLPSGVMIKVRGNADVGRMVFVRNVVIEGYAPDLQVIEIEV